MHAQTRIYSARRDVRRGWGSGGLGGPRRDSTPAEHFAPAGSPRALIFLWIAEQGHRISADPTPLPFHGSFRNRLIVRQYRPMFAIIVSYGPECDWHRGEPMRARATTRYNILRRVLWLVEPFIWKTRSLRANALSWLFDVVGRQLKLG